MWLPVGCCDSGHPVITRMITDRIGLHSVLLPLFIFPYASAFVRGYSEALYNNVWDSVKETKTTAKQNETMFSQMVSYDFLLPGLLHEYFLYLVSTHPGKPTRRCEPKEGYLRCSKRFDHRSHFISFVIVWVKDKSHLMMLALGNSEKCSRCIQTHTPFTVGSH